jgi:hypothetical protein
MPGLRKRVLTVVVVACAVLGTSAAGVLAGTRGEDTGHARHPGQHHRGGHGLYPPNVDRVDLSGYVLEASYTLGRNTGNTFRQTYTGTTVQGVPVAGPYVGQTFPAQDYVALGIAPHTVYIVWQDPETHAISDAFVMDLKKGTVFDYAPGGAQPESSGTVRVVQAGATPLP